ncbi:MAG: hypothetical protein JSV11_00880 [Nitrospiraceae bacterium]|nr:MAG: hypothetical protein JSV11_00880 [Nitrospiraceae bacterium]
MDNNPIRWILFIFCTVIFLIAAFFNGYVAWREWCRGQHQGPSFAPILFGVIGSGAVLMAPYGTFTGRLPYAWIPLFVDFGCIPYITYGLWCSFKKKRK